MSNFEQEIKDFDLKLGAVTTPHQLSIVFQPDFMRRLGVDYDKPYRTYVVRTQGKESFEAKEFEKIVYLGFGQWKKQRN